MKCFDVGLSSNVKMLHLSSLSTLHSSILRFDPNSNSLDSHLRLTRTKFLLSPLLDSFLGDNEFDRFGEARIRLSDSVSLFGCQFPGFLQSNLLADLNYLRLFWLGRQKSSLGDFRGYQADFFFNLGYEAIKTINQMKNFFLGHELATQD